MSNPELLFVVPAELVARTENTYWIRAMGFLG